LLVLSCVYGGYYDFSPRGIGVVACVLRRLCRLPPSALRCRSSASKRLHQTCHKCCPLPAPPCTWNRIGRRQLPPACEVLQPVICERYDRGALCSTHVRHP